MIIWETSQFFFSFVHAMEVIGNQNSCLQNTFFYVPQKKVSHSGLSSLNYVIIKQIWVNYPFTFFFIIL